MKYIGILILAVLTGLADLPRLARRRKKRDLIVAGLFLVAGTTLALLWSAQMPLPTIGDVMQAIARPLFGD